MTTTTVKQRIKTGEFPVNLQVGLITAFENDQVVGCYHHNLKSIVILIPWNANDFTFSKEFKDYKIFTGMTDLLTIGCWTNKNGFVELPYLLK